MAHRRHQPLSILQTPWILIAFLVFTVGLVSGCRTTLEPSAPPIVGPDDDATAAIAAALNGRQEARASTAASLATSPQPSLAAKVGGPVDNLAAVTAPLPRTQAHAQAAPFGLTASDGTGLRLRSVDARVVVDGPLAFTELHLTFENPAPRRLEGRFALTLPPGAAVSRFAMKTGGRWMEGEVVERKRARRIYEDYLHKRQDPALLEVDAGNRFRARVFPIPARGQKHLIVSWSQERVDPRAAYRLPLVGLPTLDRLRVRAWLYGKTGGARVVQLDRAHLQPAVDLELYPSALGKAVEGFRSGRVAMARITGTTTVAAVIQDEAWVLVDTSASTTRYQGATLQLLPRIAQELADGGVKRIVVVGFDQNQRVLWRGAPAKISAAVSLLRERGAMGASDLAGALAFVTKKASSHGKKRLVLISDGIATAGAREQDALRTSVRALGPFGFARADTISLAAARDEPLLTSLVRGQLRRDGVFIRPSRDGSGLERLGRQTLAPIEVKVPGAAWVWPQTLRGLQAGQSALVWAELPADAPFTVQLTGGITATKRPETRPAMAPLLRRAWIQARIAMLANAHMGDATQARAQLKAKAIELSLRHRVLSPWTAFLVLESRRELRRYGIAQTDPSGILTVAPNGQAARLSRRNLHRSDDDADGRMWGTGLDKPTASDPGKDGSGRPEPGLKKGLNGAKSRPTAGGLHQRLASGEDAKVEAAHAPPQGSRNPDVQAALRRLGVAAQTPQSGPSTVRSGPSAVPPAPRGGFAPDSEPQRGSQPTPSTGAGVPRDDNDEDGRMGTRTDAERRQRRVEERPQPVVGDDAARADRSRPITLSDSDEASDDGSPRSSFGQVDRAQTEGELPTFKKERRRRPTARPGSTRRARDELLRGRATDSFGAHGVGSGGGHDPGYGGAVPRGRPAMGGLRAEASQRWQRVSVQTTSLRVVGPLTTAQARASLSRRRAAFRRCATNQMRRISGTRRGWLQLNILVGPAGRVSEASVRRNTAGAGFGRCVVNTLRHIRFPAVRIGRSSMVTWTAAIVHGSSLRPTRRPTRRLNRGTQELNRAKRKAAGNRALTGRMGELQRLLDRKEPRLARDLARRWAADRPDDVLAWVALGRALRAAGQTDAAARAWGSILDLHPSRADMRRFAGNLLEQVSAGHPLARDTYAEAVRQRPDHPSGYVQQALAQARAGDTLAALRSLRAGLSAHRRRGRSRRGVDKTIRRLSQVLAGAWLKRHPKDSASVTAAAGWVVPDTRSVGMLLMTWESDANDVDLHVFGRHNSHAFYTRKSGAGGRLTADVTKGYGPELFESRDTRSRRVLVHYYRRGPMGFGLGRVLRMNHDGKGGLTFAAKPFIAMRDHAWVDIHQL